MIHCPKCVFATNISLYQQTVFAANIFWFTPLSFSILYYSELYSVWMQVYSLALQIVLNCRRENEAHTHFPCCFQYHLSELNIWISIYNTFSMTNSNLRFYTLHVNRTFYGWDYIWYGFIVYICRFIHTFFVLCFMRYIAAMIWFFCVFIWKKKKEKKILLSSFVYSILFTTLIQLCRCCQSNFYS